MFELNTAKIDIELLICLSVVEMKAGYFSLIGIWIELPSGEISFKD